MTTGTDVSAQEISVLEAPTLQKGTRMVIGTITAGILTENHLIPRRDTRKKTGYQRDVSTTRVNRLIQDLEAGRVDLPTAVLLNLRDFDPMDVVPGNGQKVLLPDDKPFYVVDGQHRIEALKRLVERDPEKWTSYRIAFVCMLGASEREEMEQFYVVNSTAKSVRTDLALDLLKQRAESDPEIMTALIERGESWKVKAQTLVEDFEKTSPVWQGRIRFPGEPKGSTTISSSGMVSSLKKLLGTPYFGSITTENQVKILDAFWRGVKQVIPEAFEEPSSYVVQKTIGVQVMHTLVVYVLEYVRSKGWSVVEPDSYSDSLGEALQDLQGDTSEGAVVAGADFWQVGSEGAAGSFSSNAGRRVLSAKLRSGLPSVEVE